MELQRHRYVDSSTFYGYCCKPIWDGYEGGDGSVGGRGGGCGSRGGVRGADGNSRNGKAISKKW